MSKNTTTTQIKCWMLHTIVYINNGAPFCTIVLTRKHLHYIVLEHLVLDLYVWKIYPVIEYLITAQFRQVEATTKPLISILSLTITSSASIMSQRWHPCWIDDWFDSRLHCTIISLYTGPVSAIIFFIHVINI
jgi:hypothetical protein